jgi:hypothetical protein
MDATRFDDMVRQATAPGSRRSALGVLAGALVGALGLARTASAAGRGPGGHGKDGKGGGRDEATAQRRRPRHCTERCGGRCRPRCPDVMLRNPTTCACECPGDMNTCGKTCVGADRCCAGEKTCGGGCIREDDCCPHTHQECPDGNCVAKDSCCPGEHACSDGNCIRDGQCCPDERQCHPSGCVPQDACCPNIESTCASGPDRCCVLGSACSDDGCCPETTDSGVCSGKCTPLTTNENCGACGNRCGRCTTCKRVNGDYVCAPPDAAPPACETCSNGQVAAGVSCGSRCCGAGAECCGNGCCAAGKCTTGGNGVPCCLKVVDNRPFCVVL